MTVDIATLAIRIDSLEARNAQRDLRGLRDAGAGAEASAESMTKSFGRLAAQLVSVGSALALLKAMVETQRQFDIMNSSLITATGSLENAGSAFKALAAFAASTPYSLAETTKAFIQMRNMGLDPSEAALRSYGNTAAAMGKSLEQMVGAVADAATGEFERLKEFGIKAKAEGDKVSLTFQGTTTKIGNNAKAIEGYLKNLGDTQFAGGMELRAATLDGAISNLGDTWATTMLAMSNTGGGDLAHQSVLGLTAALGDLKAIMESLTSSVDGEGKAVKEASGLHFALTTIFEAVAVLGINVAYVFNQVGKEIGGLAAMSAAVAQGELGHARAIRASMREESAKDRAEVDARSAAILGASAKAQKAIEDEAAAKKAAGRDDLEKYRIDSKDKPGLSAEKKAAIKAEAEAYKTLASSIKEKIAANELELAGASKITDAQRMTMKLDAEIATGKSKLSATSVAHIRSMIETVAEQDALILSAANVKKAVEELNNERASSYEKAMSEVQANEELVATFGMTKLQIEQLTLARMEDRLAQRASLELDEQEVAQLERMIDVKKRNVAAVGKLDSFDKTSSLAQAKELLDILVQIDEATKSAAQGMAASFGAMGSAIGGLTTALSGYARTQQGIVAQLAAVRNDKSNSPEKVAQAEVAAARSSAQARIKSYGDMASAAKGFFKENSKGYQVLEGVEKTFRAFEMAMAIETMLKKSGLLQAFTGLFVAGKATETAATVASVGPDVAASMAKGNAAALAGVANQAQGDPYSAWARMAAMAAVMVGLGFAVSGVGGSGKSVSQQRQETQGTGSVFGASDAKSNSIARAVEIAAANSSIELNYTAGMLASLRNIESSLGGLGNLLIRGSGVSGTIAGDRNGAAQNFGSSTIGTLALGGPFAVILDKIFGGFLSKTMGKVLGSIFGGKVTTLDTGITANKGSLGSVLSGGVTASQYTDTKKSGGWFRSDKYSTQLSGLGSEADAQFTKVISNMSEAIKQAGGLIGQSGDAFNQRLNSFVVDIGKISLKGLSGEEIQKELEAVFSKLGDDMAKYAVGGLAQFQQVGEGYLETLVRVATNYANLDATLQSIGKTFGATGLASIAARENLIDLMGGIDELATKASSFADNYLTEAERLAPVQKYVTEQLRAMGLASLDTRDKFKQYVLGLDLTSDAGQKQYAALMQLEAAFAKTHAATKDLTKSEQAIADERASLQRKLDEMTKTSAELRAMERAEIDVSNRYLFDQISARQDLVDAYDRESSAMQSLVDNMKSAQSSTLAYKDSLALGNLSTLTPIEKAAEAQRQYEASIAKVRANPKDGAAYSASQAAATAYLTASQVINASSDAQVQAVARVQADMAMLADLAGTQMTDAQLQLTEMEKQYGQLVTLNQTVLSFKDALLAVYAVQPPPAASGPAPVVPFPEINYSTFGTANTEPLIAEIQSLRAEVAGLRADQQKQAGDMMKNNEQVNLAAAKLVVEGTVSAAAGAAWAEESAKELIK